MYVCVCIGLPHPRETWVDIYDVVNKGNFAGQCWYGWVGMAGASQTKCKSKKGIEGACI